MFINYKNFYIRLLDFLKFISVNYCCLVYQSDRCSTDFQMYSDLPKCNECMTRTKKEGKCIDVNESLPVCGIECSVRGFCPFSEVTTPYGMYNWKQSVVSDEEIKMPCMYDESTDGIKINSAVLLITENIG